MMADISFGFAYDHGLIDMIDNEFITIKLVHEHKISHVEKTNQEIELYDCTHTNHLNN